MARKTMLVSDLSGDLIPEGKAVEVRLTPQDRRKEVTVMDVTEDEAKAMGVKGRKVHRRGRKPATA